MRVLFAGTPEVAVPALRSLMDSGEHEIVGVLTRADARKGRGRTLHPSPVAAIARDAGLDVRTPATLKEPDIREWVRGLKVDVAVVVAYGRLVPQALLDVPTHGWLNLHFSLLPSWRGAAPVQHAILHGDTETGASIFELEAGLDTGPIYAQMRTEIGAEETSGELHERLAEAGVPLINEVLAGLADGSAVATPQVEEGVTLAPTLAPADGVIDWSRSAVEIHRQLRALTPAPGCSTELSGLRLRVGPATLVEDREDLAPGELVATKRDVFVGTGTHALRLGEVAPAGKKWMPAEAWARGAHLEPGMRLGHAESEVR